MDKRYVNKKIAYIHGDEFKLWLWQKTELAVIEAGVKLGNVPAEVLAEIKEIWKQTPIDIEWWLARDKEINHDLNAFIDERIRHLRPELHQYVHRNITSFDTQEAAFCHMLKLSTNLVLQDAQLLLAAVKRLALEYRYTIMMARTHGQEAELQTFGRRCLSWYRDLDLAIVAATDAKEKLTLSKLSGAIGDYGSIDPELERVALEILGFEPYYGATQIMPRAYYAPLAQAIGNLVLVIDKVAGDIRLNARSGRPLMREPFGKKQKGSSAMPHKKNPISLEQIEGLGRMAMGYVQMITANIRTWEERAIEQSCVERVAWPDLFHAASRAITVLTRVLNGLVVFPENMLREVHESRGVYASSEAKEFLKARLRLSHEDAYRLVQLACFNAFEPSKDMAEVRGKICASYEESEKALAAMRSSRTDPIVSIRDLIMEGVLRPSAELDVAPEKVDEFNRFLKGLFVELDLKLAWYKLFEPAFLLQREAALFEKILGA